MTSLQRNPKHETCRPWSNSNTITNAVIASDPALAGERACTPNVSARRRGNLSRYSARLLRRSTSRNDILFNAFVSNLTSSFVILLKFELCHLKLSGLSSFISHPGRKNQRKLLSGSGMSYDFLSLGTFGAKNLMRRNR